MDFRAFEIPLATAFGTIGRWLQPSPKSASATDDWDTRALRAVDAEIGQPGALAAFLKDQTIWREKYLLLLEHTLANHPDNNDLYNAIFNCVRDDQRRHSTAPKRDEDGRWSIKDVRQDRGTWDKTIPRISYYDIFVSSIERWNRNDESQTDPIYECPIITKKILDFAEQDLCWGGAIHACAEYNLGTLLVYILDELLEKYADNVQQRLQITFLSGPDSEATALGVAIKRHHLDCIRVLLSAGAEVAVYVAEGKNVLMDDSSEQPILHTVLKWGQEKIAMTRRQPQNEGPDYQPLLQLLRAILRAYRGLLTHHDKNGMPPYQYAISPRSMFQGTIIEQFLREEIFELRDPDRVVEALYNKNDPGKEIGLDLSDFNYQTHRFEVFVERLLEFSDEEPGERWLFEDTLIYLNLPSLRENAQLPSVADFFFWLHDKGVQRIKSLRLPDSRDFYTVEFVVQHILQPFQVDELDWVRLHVNLPLLARTCIATEDAKRPTELKTYHYSDASRCSSRGIADEASIQWIKEIQTLRAAPVNIVTPPELTTVLVPLDPSLSTWRTLSTEDPLIPSAVFQSDPRTFSRRTEHKISYLQDELRQCNTFLNTLANWGTKPCQDPWTRHCLKVMNEQKAKVALIDNGVDQMGSLISKNIAEGASFVRSGGRTEIPTLPWFTAAHAHGTQMACLIREANRWCRLYPARVGSLQLDIDDEAAAKAIEWAISKQVDIISISWVLRKKNARLEQAIRAAVEKDILIFCSTPDSGSHSGPSIFPANYENVITVSAADPFGGVRPESCQDVHLMLGGEDIPADGPHFMSDYAALQTGSSVATALAAGLASLCLFLARMANVDGSGDKFKCRLHMLALFRRMQMNNRDRVLLPSLLFGQSFVCAGDFTHGQSLPPDGLRQFLWPTMDGQLRSSREKPFNGVVPRRDLSRIRHAERGAA